MNYGDYVTALGELLVVPITSPASANPSSDSNFNNILPDIITDAEQRIYRELDFLAQREVDSSLQFAAGVREITIPSTMIVVQSVNVITPSATLPSAGTRNKLELVSKDFLDTIWPNQTGVGATGIPQYGAMQDAITLLVAPTPDDVYTVEFTGTFRPTSLSYSNVNTYLTLHYPDLFLAASMTFGQLYQRDVDAPADAPQMSTKWEQHYQTLKQSVMDEAQRQKWQSSNWTSLSPAPLSTMQRP